MNLGKLFTRRKLQELSESSLTENGLRDQIISQEEMRNIRFNLAASPVPGEKGDWVTHGECLRDVARSLYGWDEPKVRPAEQVLPSHRLNREVMREILKQDDFHTAREFCLDSPEDALFAALAMDESLRASAESLAEHVENQNEAKVLEEALEDCEQELEALREHAREAYAAGDEVQLGVVKDKIAREMTLKRERQEELGAVADVQVGLDRGAVKRAAQGAACAAREGAEIGHAMAGIGVGPNSGMNGDASVQLAQELVTNPMLRQIALMAGRMIRDMRMKRQARNRNVKIEPVGVTTGRDIDSLLPHELARAFNPKLRLSWIKQFSERSLLEYERSGKEKMGKGPIVFVLDSSGSMAGMKMIWAQSVGLALLSIARREKRAFAAIHFAGEGATEEFYFNNLVPPDEGVLKTMLTTHLSGGTMVNQALLAARNIIADDMFKDADIVIATDGQVSDPEPALITVRSLRNAGVRIHGIAINCPRHAFLNQACDWWCSVADLAGGSNPATDGLAQQLS